jgi:hypothetical protein
MKLITIMTVVIMSGLGFVSAAVLCPTPIEKKECPTYKSNALCVETHTSDAKCVWCGSSTNPRCQPGQYAGICTNPNFYHVSEKSFLFFFFTC